MVNYKYEPNHDPVAYIEAIKALSAGRFDFDDFEQEFIESCIDRIDRYHMWVRFSDKQREVIARIAGTYLGLELQGQMRLVGEEDSP